MEARWPISRLARVAVPAVAVVGLLAAGSGSIGAPRAGTPPPCAAIPDPARLTAQIPGAWFRLAPRLDAQGSIVGEALHLGAGDRRWTIELPVEASADGPYGGLVLLVVDDGLVSELRLVDVETGCAAPVAVTPDVVRSAILDPARQAIYEHRVDRTTRADRGIWRRALDRPDAARPVVGPLPPDDRFGPTFLTELRWSLDGRRLGIASCGAIACRIRIYDPSQGSLRLLDDPDQGPLVGLTASEAVTYAGCGDVAPCPVVARPLLGTGRRTLVEAAGSAIIADRAGHPQLVHEPHDGVAEILDLETGARTAAALPPGFHLLASAPGSNRSGVAAPTGWIPLVDPGLQPGRDGIRLLRLADGLVAPAGEDLP
jgi:hypothetical protein